MKIFTACLGTETNTFAPLPTDTAAYEATYVVRGGAHPADVNMFAVPLMVWRRRAEARGWQVIESLCAFATPSGTTVKRTYETFRDEILADLKDSLPVDAVMLSLHGAMVSDGYDDCEGDLVHRIRGIVGPEIPIGVEFDLHCHIGRRFAEEVTALVIFKEYPHTDFEARAEELWDIIADTLEGKIKPVMSVFDCRMIGLYHTTREPMRGFVRSMQALEGKDGVLSVSLGHGFPWADIKELGSRVVVVTDDRWEHGARLAGELGRTLWTLKGEITPRYLDMEAAIDRALAAECGPVVLADMSDNPGGGAAGDSTFIARRLLERGIDGAAVGSIWDPVATAVCIGTGEGATLNLRLGGKAGPESGAPLDLKATVTKVVRDCPMEALGGSKRRMGDAVAVRASGTDFIVHSLRCQNMNPSIFVKLGIDPRRRKILVVKSMQHFYAAYAPIATEVIYVAAPGTLSFDIRSLPFTKVARPLWPLDDDPWAESRARAW